MAEEDTFLYLDFNNKVSSGTFEKEAFIHIANLHKTHPLVQVNDTIFEGKYDYTMGTNLFLEKVQEPSQPSDPFIQRGQIQFEYFAKNIKTINLKPVKVPPRKVGLAQESSKLEFNLDWDYSTLLEKFSDGSLKLQDILKCPGEEPNDENIDANLKDENMDVEEQESPTRNYSPSMDASQQAVEIKYEDESILEEIIPTDILEDYNKLRELSFRPIKKPPVLDKIEECDSKYREAYEYHNLEKQILQPCDFFRNEPVSEIREETLSNCADIDRCVIYNLLEKSFARPRILTKEEKEKVFVLENFDNLSLAGRYYVLKTHVENLENYLKTIDSFKLGIADGYGRTPLQTLEIYKKLTDAVKNRLEEIKFSLQEDTEVNTNAEQIEIEESEEPNNKTIE